MTKRRFIRKPSKPTAPQLDAPGAFIGTLARGGIAEFFDGPLTSPWLAFRLIAGDRAILVRAPDGRHLGTFADPVPAAAHGFHRLDQEAEQQRAAQRHPLKRRSAKEHQS